MSSGAETTKLPDGDEVNKDSVVSVRLASSDDEKMVRRAAVEVDKTRSEFMAEAAVEKARQILGQASAA